MKLNRIIKISWNNLTRRSMRSLLTVIGIGVAIGVLFVLINGVQVVKNQIVSINQKRSDITRIYVNEKETDDPSKIKAIKADTLEQIKQIPGVKKAYPDYPLVATDFISYNMSIVSSKSSQNFNIYSTSPIDKVAFSKTKSDSANLLKTGQYFSDDNQTGVVLSESLAKQVGASVGNTVSLKSYRTIEVNQPDGQVTYSKSFIADYPLTVVGIIDQNSLDTEAVANAQTFNNASENDVALVGLKSAEKIWNDTLPLINADLPADKQKSLGYKPGEYIGASVDVEDFGKVKAISKQIEDKGYEVQNVARDIDAINANFAILQAGVFLLGLVGIVIAFVNIANTILMSILERRHEIGIYKALGMKNKFVRRIFTVEAAMLGFAGSIVGIILATIAGGMLASLATQYLIGDWIADETLATLGISPDFVIHYGTDWSIVVLTIIFATLVAILASALPAQRAAKLDPIESIHAD